MERMAFMNHLPKGKPVTRINVWMLAVMAMLLLTSCGGKKDVTAYMTSKEHFEYAMKFFNKKNYTKAQEQFSLITYKYSGSDLADDAQFYLAECYYFEEDYVSSASEYDRLVSSYPRSEFVEKAMYKLALSYYELSPHYALDQKFTHEALNAVQNFIDLYPRSEYLAAVEKIHGEIKLKLARKEFVNATIYRKISEFEAAIAYYDFVITGYGDSPYAVDSRFWKGYCFFKLKEYQKAQLILRKFVDDYPDKKDLVKDANSIMEKILRLPPPKQGENISSNP